MAELPKDLFRNWYYLDDTGHPQPVTTMAQLKQFEDGELRRVASTHIEEPELSIHISTVFLGLDHGFPGEDTVPVLWETLVFNGPLNGQMERYTSVEAALAGHDAMVRRVREALSPEP